MIFFEARLACVLDATKGPFHWRGMLWNAMKNSRIQDIQNGVRDLSHTCRNREELDVLMIPHDS